MNDEFFESSYLYAGCVLSENRLVLLCRRNYEAKDAICLAFFVDGTALHELELPGDFFVGVASIGDRVVFAAQMGRTVIVDAPIGRSWDDLVASRIEQRINDVDDFGELTKTKTFDSTFWICGQFGQLYKLSNFSLGAGGFGVASLKAPDFEDIAGKSSADIVGGGLFGEMHRYDGKNWQKVDLSTNQNIRAIIVSDDGKYYAAGYNGLLLVGGGDSWALIGDPIPDKHYQDLAFHNGKLFLLHTRGIDEVAGDERKPVGDSFGDGTKLRKFARGHGRLIAIGQDRLFEHVGGKWSVLPLPPIH